VWQCPRSTEEWQRRPGPTDGRKAVAQPGNGMLQMNETCDRCGPAVRAAYRVTRDGELYPLPTLCEPALAGAVRARLGIHRRPPGGRTRAGRALVGYLGRLGLVCPC
jgi:hypothetical protein